MRKDFFAQCIGLLQSQFGSISEDRVKSLWFAIEEFSDEQILSATKRVIRSFIPTSAKPFPVPADFIEAAGVGSAVRAQELMGLIQSAVFSVGSSRSVDFGSPALHSVIQRFGGWPTICQWGQQEWNINEGRFLKSLEHSIEYGDSGPEYLRGIIEAHNGNVDRAGLSHVLRDRTGKIKIAAGLHPETKLLTRNEYKEPSSVKSLTGLFDMNSQLQPTGVTA